MNKRKWISFLLALSLLIGCMSGFTVSAATSELKLYEGTEHAWDTPLLLNSGDVAVRFNSTVPFSGVTAWCPNWTANAATDNWGLNISLYAWDKDYDTTTSGTAITTKDYIKYAEDAFLPVFDFGNQTQGEYLIVMKNAGTNNSGVWAWSNTPMPNVYTYVNGERYNGTASFKLIVNQSATLSNLKRLDNDVATVNGTEYYIFEAENYVKEISAIQADTNKFVMNSPWPWGGAKLTRASGKKQQVVMRFWDANTLVPGGTAGQTFGTASSVNMKVNAPKTDTYELYVYGSAKSAVAGKLIVNGVTVPFTYIQGGTPAIPGEDVSVYKGAIIAAVSIDLNAGTNDVSLVSMVNATSYEETIQPDVILIERKEIVNEETEVYMYSDTANENHDPIYLVNGQIGQRFNAVQSFTGLKLFVHNPGGESATNHVTLSLYAWDSDYAKTLQGTALATGTIENIVPGDHVYAPINFDTVPAGEYLVVTSDLLGNLVVWSEKAQTPNIISYINGTADRSHTHKFSIVYTQDPGATAFAPLSSDYDVIDGKKYSYYEAEDYLNSVSITPTSDTDYPDVWLKSGMVAGVAGASGGHAVIRFWNAQTEYPWPDHGLQGTKYPEPASVEIPVNVDVAGTYNIKIIGSFIAHRADTTGLIEVNGVPFNFNYTAAGIPNDAAGTTYAEIASLYLPLNAGANTIKIISTVQGHVEGIQLDKINVAMEPSVSNSIEINAANVAKYTMHRGAYVADRMFTNVFPGPDGFGITQFKFFAEDDGFATVYVKGVAAGADMVATAYVNGSGLPASDFTFVEGDDTVAIQIPVFKGDNSLYFNAKSGTSASFASIEIDSFVGLSLKPFEATITTADTASYTMHLLSDVENNLFTSYYVAATTSPDPVAPAMFGVSQFKFYAKEDCTAIVYIKGVENKDLGVRVYVNSTGCPAAYVDFESGDATAAVLVHLSKGLNSVYLNSDYGDAGAFTSITLKSLTPISLTETYDESLDVSDLEAALAIAKGIDQTIYSEDTTAALAQAIADGEAALAAATTDEEIQDAVFAILDAIDGLLFNDDVLEQAIKDAKAIDTSKYTDATVAVLKKAIADAESALASGEGTEAAYHALQAAISGLRPKKDALQSLYDELKALDKSKYTDASYAALDTALKEAKAVLDNADATLEQVEAAYAKLAAAKAGLKLKGTNPITGSIFEITQILVLAVGASSVVLRKKRKY